MAWRVPFETLQERLAKRNAETGRVQTLTYEKYEKGLQEMEKAIQYIESHHCMRKLTMMGDNNEIEEPVKTDS